MMDPQEYQQIIAKLLEKTKAGKIDWTEHGEDRFLCELPGRYQFEISRFREQGDTHLSVNMKDDNAKVIFSVALTDDPNTLWKHQEQFKQVDELYELARRKALKVDEKLEYVSELLDRI